MREPLRQRLGGSRRRLLFGLALVSFVVAVTGGFYAAAFGPRLASELGLEPVIDLPAPPDRAPSDTRALPRRLRVLVWNVYKGQREGWRRRFEKLARGAHLILLQEAWLELGRCAACAMGQALLGCEGLSWQMAISWVSDGEPPFCTGVATGAAAPPRSCTPLVSRGREPLFRTPKTALITRYALEGSREPLVVVNLHGLNIVGAETFGAQLDRIAAELARDRGPLLFAGDFNAWSDAKLARMRSSMARLGLEEVRFGKVGENSASPDERTRVFGNALDYAFVRGLEVLAARTDRSEASDHAALVLELRVRAGEDEPPR